MQFNTIASRWAINRAERCSLNVMHAYGIFFHASTCTSALPGTQVSDPDHVERVRELLVKHDRRAMKEHWLHGIVCAGLLALGLGRVHLQLAAHVDELLRP